MGFAPQPILGKVRSFFIPGGSAPGWNELSPELAGITDRDMNETWERRAWFAIASPAHLTLSFVDPALGIPNTMVVLRETDHYHEFFYGGPVWIDDPSGEVFVIYGY